MARSEKAKTNHKWTSSDDYRAKWDSIFGKKKKETVDEEKPQVPEEKDRKEGGSAAD